jgi:hypothetical protein
MRKCEDKQWNKQYEKLVDFKRKNGNCLVLQRYQEDAILGSWVHRQRVGHANNTIRPERKDLLDELGFAWKVPTGIAANDKTNAKNWHQQYEKLVEFKRKNGNCLVRNKYEQDKSLGLWVMTQRGRHANIIMRQDRKELLDEIGFVWRVEKSAITSALWNKRYEKLVKLKRKNGNCLVPQRDEEGATLGMWASSEQRVRHADNKMRPDRKILLDELEFVGQVIIFLTFVLFLLLTCRIRIWNRSPAVWVSQTKH